MKLTQGMASRFAGNAERLIPPSQAAFAASRTTNTAPCAGKAMRHQAVGVVRGANIDASANTARKENQNPAPRLTRGASRSTAARTSSSAPIGCCGRERPNEKARSKHPGARRSQRQRGAQPAPQHQPEQGGQADVQTGYRHQVGRAGHTEPFARLRIHRRAIGDGERQYRPVEAGFWNLAQDGVTHTFAAMLYPCACKTRLRPCQPFTRPDGGQCIDALREEPAFAVRAIEIHPAPRRLDSGYETPSLAEADVRPVAVPADQHRLVR